MIWHVWTNWNERIETNELKSTTWGEWQKRAPNPSLFVFTSLRWNRALASVSCTFVDLIFHKYLTCFSMFMWCRTLAIQPRAHLVDLIYQKCSEAHSFFRFLCYIEISQKPTPIGAFRAMIEQILMPLKGFLHILQLVAFLLSLHLHSPIWPSPKLQPQHWTLSKLFRPLPPPQTNVFLRSLQSLANLIYLQKGLLSSTNCHTPPPRNPPLRNMIKKFSKLDKKRWISSNLHVDYIGSASEHWRTIKEVR